MERKRKKRKESEHPSSDIEVCLPCLIVYPDRKHVEYVFNILNPIKELLLVKGFNPILLSEEALPDTHFGKSFEELADKCVLGVVILDGLRPNFIFEYGFLRGKGKPVIPIQDKRGCISVKSFYQIPVRTGDVVKSATGLTPIQFQKLKNPPIGYWDHISDRGGIKVVVVDCGAPADSPEHPKNKFEKELENYIKSTPIFQISSSRRIKHANLGEIKHTERKRYLSRQSYGIK